jgi:DNA invertase Pin-like site-specific DNA recombinase
MRIAIYARVSTDKQDNDNQLIQLREFAAKHGRGIVAEYVDTATGSGKKERTQFDAMMLAGSQKQFDLLLFWKLDRFSREGVRKTLVHLTRLEGWGVNWRSFMEPYFDSCGQFRDVVISIMATLAEQERINISERTKAGLRKAKMQGKKLGAPAIAVDMATVRARRAAGDSLRAIATDLGVSPSLLVKKENPLKKGEQNAQTR